MLHPEAIADGNLRSGSAPYAVRTAFVLGGRRDFGKMIRTYSRLCLVSCLLWRPCLEAEPPRVPEATTPAALAGDTIFEHLNESSGLANPVVSQVTEDGDGFIWVGTQSGLQRWDGYRFATYKTQLTNPSSLPDNLTQALHTDTAGRLWVGTSSGGLARYDRERDKFVRYRTSSNGVAPVDVLCIEDDGLGGLWVGSGTGLDHLDTETGTFTHVSPENAAGKAIEPGMVSALLRSAAGTLWIGGSKGLLRGTAATGKVQHVEHVLTPDRGPLITVYALFGSRDGTVWVGTDHGVYLIDLAAYAGQRELASAATASALPTSEQAGIMAHRLAGTDPQSKLLSSGHITALATDLSGGIWLGTQEQGAFIVSPGTHTIRHVAHDATQPTSLAGDWIASLYLSHQGMMWVGSRRGLSYLETSARGVTTLLGGDNDSSSVRDFDVYSVLPRSDGTIWLGLSKHGIDVLEPSGRRVARIEPRGTGGIGGTSGSLPDGTVGAMSENGNGGLYIVTQHGLYLAESTNLHPGEGQSAAATHRELLHARFSKLPIGPEAAEGLFQVLLDHDAAGRPFLWLGGSDGLWTFDPAGHGPALRAKLNAPLTDPRIRVLLRGAGNTLWVGTLNGLNRLNLATGDVLAIAPDQSNPQGLGAGLISSLILDRKERLWVGTFSGGINVLEDIDHRGRVRFHRIIDGLPSENVDRLLEARDGKIWASTDGGLAVIDPFNFDVSVLTQAEGAYVRTYWDGSGGKTVNGDLVFGGSGGVTLVRPTMVRPWTYAPPVVITSARIGLTDVPLARFNSGLSVYPVWVPADQNNLTVEFAALDYSAPYRNRYEYKLEGFDRNWVAADPARRVARYTNLPPGKYTLLLRGSNRDGVWAPPRQVRIMVLPTWYQKAWFRILSFLVILLLLFAIFLLATAYMRRQQRELERQVALRTAELEQKTVELKQSQQKLEHMAYTDSLTGLPNRRMFTEHFRRLLALKRRQQSTFALLLMDFDGFKSINDTFGHDAGDAVLKEMAQRMSAVVRESDILARLGGDEFGLILGQSPDMEATENVCHKLVESFRPAVLFQGIELRTSPSVGVALYPYDGSTQDKLFKTADNALYAAKRSGGNGCTWSEGAAAQTQLRSVAR